MNVFFAVEMYRRFSAYPVALYREPSKNTLFCRVKWYRAVASPFHFLLWNPYPTLNESELFFIGQLAIVHEKRVQGVTSEALRVLMAHDYPGNIRELENIIEHGFVLTSGPLIGIEHLPQWLVQKNGLPLPGDSLEDCERRVILAALESKFRRDEIAERKLQRREFDVRISVVLLPFD